MTIDYAAPGPLTNFGDEHLAAVVALGSDPLGLCRAAQGLVVDINVVHGLPEGRYDEREIRPADELLRRVLARNPTALDEPRANEDRVGGTCRHFSVLSVAFLRAHGIAARARCGFASYFSPGRFVDHWIAEYDNGDRWVRVDTEILGLPIVADAADLRVGEFLTGGEAWLACRDGDADPQHFGVNGVDYAWGIGEVRGNAIRDLAALNKLEMLPWDEWSRMALSYRGESGPEFDELIDQIARVTATDDALALQFLYESEDLAVPGKLIEP
jgi:Transglutaminase-like superfamily